MSTDAMDDLRASYSSLTTHRRCPQQWTYAYARNLEAVGDAVPADVGTWWHAIRAVDSIERGLAAQSLQHMPETIKIPIAPYRLDVTPDLSTFDVLDLVHGWWRTLTTEQQAPWLDYLGEPVEDRLIYLDAAYRERWADDRKTEFPMAAELLWSRDLPEMRVDGEIVTPDFPLTGTVDEVYFDAKRGMVVIRDHKTRKALSTQSTSDDLMDSQLQLYAWGASPAITGWGKGSVRALAYDRLRAPKPMTPAVTLMGALSKSVTMYDLTTYLRWAAGPDGQGVPWGKPDTFFTTGPRKGEPKSGFYTAEESVIEKLRSPAQQSIWFQRTLTPLNRNVVRTHLRSAVDSAVDVARSARRYEATGEASRNFSKACDWCDFSGLCAAEMIGGADGDYDLRDYGLRVRVS